MKFLFVHQNFPGQYKHLAAALADEQGNEVIAIGEEGNLGRLKHPQVKEIAYPEPRGASPETHHYVRPTETSVRRGQAVVREAIKLRDSGFSPRVICCHPGWGEGLYLRDVWPDSKMLFFVEWYYHNRGFNIGFDPEFPTTFDDRFRVRTRNAHHLLSYVAADWLVTPTRWQYSTIPPEFRSKTSVIFDGIDTEIAAPDADATLGFKSGTVLSKSDEVITFINRNLEPYRGYHVFMRALPQILRRRPNAHVVIIGGDGVSYGDPPREGGSHKEIYLKEVQEDLDMNRVHFVGRVPYDMFLKVIQVSSVHVYLTVPFVLSWSMLEAMSAGCLVVGSRTPPVEEVITHNENGLLVDFFKPGSLIEAVDRVLDHPTRLQRIRDKARKDIIDRYDLKTICLPAQLELVRTLAAGKTPESSGT
ncbi:MAG: glycosyltransferase family 4 protein [Rhodospirillales bacterium]|nr:glycosyltransferase family 4 protein [Rhodospirillales bacterium]